MFYFYFNNPSLEAATTMGILLPAGSMGADFIPVVVFQTASSSRSFLRSVGSFLLSLVVTSLRRMAVAAMTHGTTALRQWQPRLRT
jgi:hypothetical protein